MNKIYLNIHEFGDNKRFNYGFNNTIISSIDFNIGFDVNFEKTANDLTNTQIEKYIKICRRLKIKLILT